MKDSSPAKGTPTSVFSCEPSAGDFSFVSPERIQASDEGVSDFDTLTFHSEDWSEMDPLTKEYLQDYDDSSSMDDSTYMSQPDTTGQVPVSGPSGQYGYVDQNPFFEQYMRYSPSQGSDSHGSRQGSQPRPSIVMQSPLIDSPSLADPGLTYTNFSQNSAGAGRPSNFDFQSSQQLSLSGARSLGQGSDVEGRVEDTWTPPEPQSYNNPFMNVEAGWGQFRPQGEYIPEDVGVQLRQPHPLSLRYQQQGGAGSVPVRTQSYPGPQPGQAMMSQDVMRRSSAAVPHGSIDPSTIVSPTGSAIHDSHETVGIFDLADNRHSFISIPSIERPGPESMGEAAADDLDDYSVSTTGQRPASEEAEIKLARSHPLYNAKPGKDDFFHCPFEGQQGCNHRAIKLKCNYDKYVDSHLKPFRCKINSCIDLRFSSTACLLRHEREAHGMHGHGSKPHLCSYPDCERSIPGHGFPRRYNLYDHMKRVHDFVDESSLPVSSSSTSAAQTNPALVQSRKRKNVAPAEELHGKRTKSGATAKEQLSAAPTNMPPPSQSRREEEQRRQERIVQWTNSRDVVIAHLQSLNRPEDVQANMQRQISGAMADFFKITSEIHGAG